VTSSSADRPWLARLRSSLRREIAPAVRSWRLLLAGKAALAAGLAWMAGRLIPEPIDDYAYYAPLGALISMTPTLMGSIRQSAQTTASLALGVGLAWMIISVDAPAPLAVPRAVGLGVLLAGIPALGPGRDYVPIAALFVLVIGGGHAGDYALGYIVQMAIGMAIGIAVNLVIVPPLYLKDAADRISELRTQIAGRLSSLADELGTPGSDARTLPPESDRLEQQLADARRIVDDAFDSRRGNPRSRWHRYDPQEDYDDLRALRRIGDHMMDVREVLRDGLTPEEVPEQFRELLASALEATAGLVRAWDRRQDEEGAAQRAHDEVRALANALEQQHADATPFEVLWAVVFGLRRIVALVTGRLRSTRATR
jgi:hypothetical protein